MKWAFLAPLSILLVSSLGSASQEKTIQSKSAKAFESPSEVSAVLERFSQGDNLKTSNEAKDHWYKVLLPNPVKGKKFAWIHESNFSKIVITKELKDAGIDRSPKKVIESTRNHWTLGFTFDASLLSSESNINFPTAGDFGYLYGIEAGYKPTIDLALITRLGGHRYNPYSIAGYTAMVGVDYTFVHFLPWKLSFSALAGYSLSTHAAGVVKSKVVTSDSFNTPDILGKLVLRYYTSQRLCFLVEGGWRYFSKKGATLGGLSVDFDLSAPLVGLGIQMDF